MEITYEKKGLEAEGEIQMQTDGEVFLIEERNHELEINLTDATMVDDLKEGLPNEDLTSFFGGNPMKIFEKWEWFHSGNLLHILEYLRLCLVNQNEEQSEDDIQKRTNEFWKLRHYGLSADIRSNRCHITYQCSEKYQELNIGRVYAYSTSLHSANSTKQIGLQNLPRWIRGALAKTFYWDLDIVNAHASILLGILESMNINSPKLSCLVANREKILQNLGLLSGFTDDLSKRKQAKKALTMVLFGASFEAVCDTLNFRDQIGNLDLIIYENLELKSLLTEMQGIANMIWKSPLFEDKFLYLKDLKSHTHILTKPNEHRKKSSFLSLFLQTEERILLAWIDKFLFDNDRKMDCLIHDGGLVRKFAAHRNGDRLVFPTVSNRYSPTFSNFDPQQAFSLAELSEYKWEEEFPDQLLRSCELYLSQISTIRYKHIKLQIKPFDDDQKWIEKLRFKVPNVPSSLRKTYTELKYYYETHHSLFQIMKNGKYMFDGETFTQDVLSYTLPERLFYPDAIVPTASSNLKKRQSSPSPVRSPTISPHSARSDDLSVMTEKTVSFWNTYSNDSLRRQVQKILFCMEELTLSQTKKPTDTMISKEIRRKYVVLYENSFSFEVMRECAQFQNLFEAFLDRNILQKTREQEKNKVAFIELLQTKLSFSNHLSEADIYGAYLFLNHIYLLCDKKEVEFLYFVQYIAKIIQKPTIKEEGCGLILYSDKEGVGKSVLAAMILDLLAPFSKETHNANDVFGQFSILQEHCILLHFEDTDATEMKLFSSHFKNRITAKTLTVERKHENKETQMNLCRYIITTNDLRGLPIGENDRRWAIIQCSSLLLGNNAYFTQLESNWASNEIRKSTFRFLYFILLDGFSCERNKPQNSLLKELKCQKLSIVKRYMIGIALWLRENVEAIPFMTCQGSEFIQRYQRKVYLKDQKNEKKTALENAFWISSQDLFGFFQQWCLSERNELTYSILSFSREVRRLLFDVVAQNDCQGKACLPICIEEWVAEGKKYGLEGTESLISLEMFFIDEGKCNPGGTLKNNFSGVITKERPSSLKDSKSNRTPSKQNNLLQSFGKKKICKDPFKDAQNSPSLIFNENFGLNLAETSSHNDLIKGRNALKTFSEEHVFLSEADDVANNDEMDEASFGLPINHQLRKKNPS